MALIGYTRVSTDDQNPALQLQAMRAAGVDQVFEDRGASEVREARQGIQKALGTLQTGDVLVVGVWTVSGALWPI